MKKSKKGKAPFIRAIFMYAAWKEAKGLFKPGAMTEYSFTDLKTLEEDLKDLGEKTGRNATLEDCIDSCGWAYQFINGDFIEILSPQSLAAMIRIMG